ncbi:hypothetical protein QJS66_16885 [Kocuria rhizophila]|nr:hypothetical protein QJS66_16885 [Kocuria rhizophila]
MNPATPPSRQGTAPTAAPPTRRAAPATAYDAGAHGARAGSVERCRTQT